MSPRATFPIALTALALLTLLLVAIPPSRLEAAESVEDTEPARDTVDASPSDPAVSLRAADESFQRYAESRDRIRFRTILSRDALFLGEELHRGFGRVLRSWDPLWNEKDGFSYRGEVLDVTVAESGELGFTVGRVETRFRPPVDSEDRVQSGHYLTIWQSGPERDGPQRDGAQPDDRQGWTVVASGPLVVHPTLGESRDPRGALRSAWPELADRIGADLDVRWAPETTIYAESGELAYVLGTYEADFSSPTQDPGAGRAGGGSGHFLTVWQKDGEGRWQLAAESMTPPRSE